MKLDTDYTCALCGKTITDDDDLHTDPRTGGDVCEEHCPVCNGEINICPECEQVSDRKRGDLCSKCLPF